MIFSESHLLNNLDHHFNNIKEPNINFYQHEINIVNLLKLNRDREIIESIFEIPQQMLLLKTIIDEEKKRYKQSDISNFELLRKHLGTIKKKQEENEYVKEPDFWSQAKSGVTGAVKAFEGCLSGEHCPQGGRNKTNRRKSQHNGNH